MLSSSSCFTSKFFFLLGGNGSDSTSILQVAKFSPASLQRSQRSPPFGTTVVAQVLGHKDVRFPQSRSLTGRLLFWDRLQDQISYVLCVPEDDVSDPLVHRAGLPVKLPPGINIDELTGDPPPQAVVPKVFDKPLDKNNDEPRDLDPEPEHDDDADSDILVEERCASLMDDLPPDCPFTFLSTYHLKTRMGKVKRS